MIGSANGFSTPDSRMSSSSACCSWSFWVQYSWPVWEECERVFELWWDEEEVVAEDEEVV